MFKVFNNYYPKGYHPHLLEHWPIDGDLVIPLEMAPKDLTDGMGAEWRLKKKNRKLLEEQSKRADEGTSAR